MSIDGGKNLGAMGIHLHQLHMSNFKRDKSAAVAESILACPGILDPEKCKQGSTHNCGECSRSEEKKEN